MKIPWLLSITSKIETSFLFSIQHTQTGMVKICNALYPKDSEYNSYFEQYKYELSDFQKYAIQGIVEGKNILVTAHTGSGKTLPALFAIEHFVKQGKKVIYTSPIKALSNQKYWEFSNKFPDISFGLLTGDIKTNPTADVLIMTTEILMNYLFQNYNQNQNQNQIYNEKDEKNNETLQIDIQTELACVVFDEVHYINDLARGHVWEQTILTLPSHIQMLMLSATIDNPVNFGNWIEHIHSVPLDETQSAFGKKECLEVWICSTEKRVVPLTHYSFITVNEGMLKGIKDESLKAEIKSATNNLIVIKTKDNHFQEKNYHQVKKMLTLLENKQQYIKRKFAVNSVLLFLREREMLPAIIFVFSRKQVELLADEITTNLLEDDSKIPYTTAYECEQIIRGKLSNYREYLELPEYNVLVKLLEKGIGIHHSGMIPILREIVELLIAKNRIKLLIATESFAIGLDCPIKTAVFISLQKFDGNQQRMLYPHEYNQMSGRAGRRGIDTFGSIVHCNNLFPFPSVYDYQQLLCGNPQKLQSKFQISYSMIFSLFKCKELDQQTVVDFVEKSMYFREIQTSLDTIKNQITLLEEKLKKKMEFLNLLKTPLAVLEKYTILNKELKNATNKKRKDITKELNSYLEYKSLEKDVLFYSEKELLHQELENERGLLQHTENEVSVKITNIISILENYGYIHRCDETEGGFEIAFTPLGYKASHFNEVHPLLFSHIIDDMYQLSPKQWVGILSCFTNIKLGQGEQREGEQTGTTREIQNSKNDTNLEGVIVKMQNFYNHLIKIEDSLYIYNQCENEPLYELVDLFMEWCDCNDEKECKYFIQNSLEQKNISIGDFTKSILKISAIVGEVENLYNNIVDDNSIVMLHTCSLIKPMILKYITTSQSLYI
jgi:superfamily II RNA helicase